MKRKDKDIYISTNYDHLLKHAIKIAGSKEEGYDILSRLVEVILTDFGYKGNVDHKRMNAYCWGVMVNIKKVDIKKSSRFVSLDDPNILDGENLDPYMISDISMKNYIDTSFEFPKTFYENELIQNGFTKEQAHKIANIKFNLRKLNPTERNLYKMYFDDNLSIRKIAKKVGIHYLGVYAQLKTLKEKILKLSEDDPNNMLY